MVNLSPQHSQKIDPTELQIYFVLLNPSVPYRKLPSGNKSPIKLQRNLHVEGRKNLPKGQVTSLYPHLT